MEPTGERFIPGQTGVIELEHFSRYYFVVNQINLTNKNILDIACGDGYGTNILAKYAQHVTGVDISEDAINHAKSKYQAKNLKYEQGDASNIPLADKQFDVVVSFETIEHHDKHQEMMYEIKRVLKEDGILIISSPDKHFYSEVSKFTNQFHIKELYFNEFKLLLNQQFKSTFFFLQRTFVGSVITADDNTNPYVSPILIDKNGLTSKFNPIYNLAIATDLENFTPCYQTVFYKQEDQIYNSEDITNAFSNGKFKGEQLVHKSKAYKLGKFILSPFIFIKNYF